MVAGLAANLGFIAQEGIDKNMPTKGVYEDYEKYCQSSGAHPFSQASFTKRLKQLGYERKQRRIFGQKIYIYELKEEEESV